MRMFFILIFMTTMVFFMSACAEKQINVGMAQPVQVPEMPVELSTKATRLPDITDPSFSNIILDGADTDIQYNSVSHQLNNLIDFYNCVRIAVNEKKELQCGN